MAQTAVDLRVVEYADENVVNEGTEKSGVVGGRWDREKLRGELISWMSD